MVLAAAVAMLATLILIAATAGSFIVQAAARHIHEPHVVAAARRVAGLADIAGNG